MAKLNILNYWRDCLAERVKYLDDAQRIADLTIPSVEPKPNGAYGLEGYSTYSQRSIKRPKSNAGCSAIRGLAGAIAAANAPTNVRFFRLAIDTVFAQDEATRKQMEAPLPIYEERIERYLGRINFFAMQHAILEQVLITGNVLLKLSKEQIYIYPLRQFAVKREWGNIKYIIIEEYYYKDDGTRGTQYIYIDKTNSKVYQQRDDEATAKPTADSADQYLVVTTEVPSIDNYGRSYYLDHYGLLKSIDETATALLEAQKICSWNWISYTGPATMSTAQISQIKPMQVVRMPNHGAVQWVSAGQKINDWQFVWQKLQADEQRLLQLSAVGLYSRAAQANTATEVMAIKSELETLTGAASQILSRLLYSGIIDASLDVLGIRAEYAAAIAAVLAPEQLTEDVLNSSVINVIATTGAPALARESDLQRLYTALGQLSQIVGPQNLAQIINIPQLMRETFDGLRVNTTNLIQQTQPQPPTEQLPPTEEQL